MLRFALTLLFWISLTPTPTPPPAPLLSMALAEELLAFGLEQDGRRYTSFNLPETAVMALDRLALEPPGPLLIPHLASRSPEWGTPEWNLAQRLNRQVDWGPQQDWWVYGRYYDRTAWYFITQPNHENLSPQALGELLHSEPESVPSPLYTLFASELCSMARAEDDPPAVHTLEPVPLAFENGTGWATFHFCLSYEWWVGDGPECGGRGADYVARIWYGFHGITTQGYLIHASVPLHISGLPQMHAGILTCAAEDGENWITTTNPPEDEWEAQGWLPFDDNLAPYPRLSDDALTMLAENIITQMLHQRDTTEGSSPLARIFGGLNDTFTTLRFDTTPRSETRPARPPG